MKEGEGRGGEGRQGRKRGVRKGKGEKRRGGKEKGGKQWKGKEREWIGWGGKENLWVPSVRTQEFVNFALSFVTFLRSLHCHCNKIPFYFLQHYFTFLQHLPHNSLKIVYKGYGLKICTR